jgi:signal transduction histidine kinase
VFFAHDVRARRQLEQQLVTAVDHEQERIGADLHDALGQQLTGIACLLRVLRDRLRERDPEAAERAAQVEVLVNGALDQARGLSRGLSPVRLEAATLGQALEDLVTQLRLWHGIEVRLEVQPGMTSIEEEHAVHLFRIAHEALGNAARHSEAATVRVQLDWRRRRLTVEDDGIGFSTTAGTAGGNLGLRLMAHRAALIGGTLNIEASPGRGTRVCCTWAVEDADPISDL